MAIKARVDEVLALPNGKVEVRFTVLVDGKEAGVDSFLFHDSAITAADMIEAIKDRVRGFKESYKKKAQAGLVGQEIVVEP